MVYLKIKDIYNLNKWTKKEKKEKRNIWLQNKVYKSSIKKEDSKKFVKLELSTIMLIIGKVLKSVIYLAVVMLFAFIVDKIFIMFGWKEYLVNFIHYDRDIFINLLISSVSIAGFLIALFYANLSGIFTSRYAFLSSRISKELLNEYTNRKYIKSIQNYIIIVLLVLLLNIIGIYTDIIMAIIIVVLTIRIIIIFIELSNRIFIYSNIIIIGKNTMSKIMNVFDKVMVGAYKYDNPSFQKYHNQIVIEHLKTLDDLSFSLIRDNDFEGLNTLLEINLKLISKYSRLKNKIPHNSLWFPNIGKGRSWFTENDTEISIAINTGTSLHPKAVKDTYFFENQLLEINQRIIEKLLANKKFEIIYNYFNIYHNYFNDFTYSGDIKFWYDNSADIINFMIEKINFKDLQDNNYVMGLLDLFSLLHIDICLNFSDYFQYTYSLVNNMDWNTFNYKKSLNSNTIIFNNEQFVDFIKRLDNEKYTEGKLVTSKKFILEYSNMKLSNHLDIIFDMMLSSFENLNVLSKKLLNTKSLKGTALINSRIIELNNKLLFQLNKLEKIYNTIISYDKKNYKYKTIDISKKREKIKNIYISSMEQYTKVVVGLYFEKYKIDDEQLDFIGELYYHLTYLMLDLIYENDYASFEKLYSNFACICSISAFYIKELISPDANAPYVLNKYTMATINFMNISGFAIYYSHLINDDKWEQLVLNYAENVIKEEQKENKGNFINNCKTCAEIINDSIVGITILSTNMKISMERFVRNTDIIKYKYVGDFGQTVIDNEDKLIKNFKLEKDYGFLGEFYDVYMIYCINKHFKNDKYISKFKWEEDDE